MASDFWAKRLTIYTQRKNRKPRKRTIMIKILVHESMGRNQR